MAMEMTGSAGVLSVPGEHLAGLVWLVAAPVTVWVTLCALHALAGSGNRPATWLVTRVAELSIAARTAVFAALVGAGVHAAIVPTHWTEDRTRALLFLFDAAAFLLAFGWALSLRRGWRPLNLIVLGGTVATYTYYLLRGWESLDLVGLLTTTIELTAALVLLDPLQSAVGPTRSRERWVAAAAVPVALVALLGTGAVADATNTVTHDHGSAADALAGRPAATHGMAGMAHGMAGMAHGMTGMTHGSASAGSGSATTSRSTRLALPTASAAGSVVWPVAMGDMGTGMTMATPPCSATPTVAQRRAAVRLVDETVAAASPYRSLAAAKAAGYVPVTPSGLSVVHYVNPAIYAEGPTLDPRQPPSLVYANTDHGAVLVAAMYLVSPFATDQRPPQPGGCLTQWHQHTNLCFRDQVIVGIVDAAGACAAGSVNRATPPMMHVWLAPVPGGPLAIDPGSVAEVRAAKRLPAPRHRNGTA